jgi:hypothetical protein
MVYGYFGPSPQRHKILTATVYKTIVLHTIVLSLVIDAT